MLLQHVCFMITVALVFQTDLDSLHAPTFSAASASSAFNASLQYHDDIEDRRIYYDLLLVVTFVFCVPGCPLSHSPPFALL